MWIDTHCHLDAAEFDADRDAVREAARALHAQGVVSFAICFLFSFMNDAHEQRAAALIREEAPGAFVSCSSAVLPRIREWPRYSTTIVNAYLAPVLARYCKDVAHGLDGLNVVTRQRFLMQSNGGVMPLVADAEMHTVRTLLSGPAAGVRGGAAGGDGGQRRGGPRADPHRDESRPRGGQADDEDYRGSGRQTRVCRAFSEDGREVTHRPPGRSFFARAVAAAAV